MTPVHDACLRDAMARVGVVPSPSALRSRWGMGRRWGIRPGIIA